MTSSLVKTRRRCLCAWRTRSQPPLESWLSLGGPCVETENDRSAGPPPDSSKPCRAASAVAWWTLMSQEAAQGRNRDHPAVLSAKTHRGQSGAVGIEVDEPEPAQPRARGPAPVVSCVDVGRRLGGFWTARTGGYAEPPPCGGMRTDTKP